MRLSPLTLRAHVVAASAWISYWAFLFVITHIPWPSGLHLPEHGDKVIHFVAYAVLAVLGGTALHLMRRLDRRRLVLWSILFIAYGAADEWLQQFVHRTTSLGDWIADAMGVLLGSLLVGVFVPRRLARPREDSDGGSCRD
jgi:VanZ family protein